MKCVKLLQKVNNLLGKCTIQRFKNNFSVKIGHKIAIIFILHIISATLNFFQHYSLYTSELSMFMYLILTYGSVAFYESILASILNYVLLKYREINNFLGECKNCEVMSGTSENFIDVATCVGLLHDVLDELYTSMGLFLLAKWLMTFLSFIVCPYESIIERNYFGRTVPWMILNFIALLTHLNTAECIKLEVSYFNTT